MRLSYSGAAMRRKKDLRVKSELIQVKYPTMKQIHIYFIVNIKTEIFMFNIGNSYLKFVSL